MVHLPSSDISKAKFKTHLSEIPCIVNFKSVSHRALYISYSKVVVNDPVFCHILLDEDDFENATDAIGAIQFLLQIRGQQNTGYR